MLALTFAVIFTALSLQSAFAQVPSTVPLCEITRNLQVGLVGQDVHCLQRYLNWSGYRIAESGPGSLGQETMYYGSLTRAAVVRWQEANATNILVPLGLTQGTGFWGPASFARYVAIVKAFLGVA